MKIGGLLVTRLIRPAGFGLVALVVGAISLIGHFGQPVITGNAAGPTAVCGALTTQTWNSAGSPYNICVGGVTIGNGVTVTIDGTGGPVQVSAAGSGGISVNSGVLQTTNMSSTNSVRFSGPTVGTWNGIWFATDASNVKPTGTLAYATISGAAYPIYSGIGTLNLSHVTIDSASSMAVYASSTDLTFSDGTISNASGRGISHSSGTLSVTNSTIKASGASAIVGTSLAGKTVTITGNTIDNTISAGNYSGAGAPGIELDGANLLTLQNNSLTGTGGGPAAATPYAAIWLNGFDGDLTAQTGNQGANNGLDLIAFHGAPTKGFTWKTPTNSATMHDLGYFLDGTVTFTGPQTLTLKANDVVKLSSGYIALNGGILDASDVATGPKTVTVARDNSVGLKTCPSQFVTDCPNPLPTYEYWQGFYLQADNLGNKASGTMLNGVLKYASNAFYVTSQSTAGLTVTNSSIGPTSSDAIYSSSTPLTVTGTTITNAAGKAIYNTGAALSVTNSTIRTSGGTAIYGSSLAGKVVSITGNTIDDTITPGTYSGASAPGIQLDSASTLALQNNSVTGTGGGPAAAIPYAAIWLNGFTGDLTAQTGNQGNNNGLDLIAFHGTPTKGFTWKTPTNSATLHDLGYLLDGTLTLNGAQTLTLRANDVVKLTSGSISLNGGILDASDTTAGPKTVTVARDNTVGLKTCPSQFTTDCPNPLPTYEYWSGFYLTADNLGNNASGTIVNGVLKYASNAAYITSQSTAGLTVTNSTIGPTSSDAIYASSTPLTVTGTAITGAGGKAISDSGAALTANNNTISASGGTAIYATALAGKVVSVKGNTINNTLGASSYSGAGAAGIELDGADANLTMQDNSVTGTGGGPAAAIPYAAIWLNGFTGDLTAQTGNQGNNNGLDLIAFHGTPTKGFTWKTPTNSATLHELGYLLDGSLTLNGAQTLTLKANDVVKLTSGYITLNGGILDASDTTAGTKTVTVARDNTVGLKTCPSQFTSDCPNPLPTYEYWSGFYLQADNLGNKASATINNAALKYASNAAYINSGSSAGLRVTNSTIGPTSSDAISASSTPLTVNSTTINNAAGKGINQSLAPLTVTNSTITDSGGVAIYATSLAGKAVTVSGNTIDDTLGTGYTGAGAAGIELDGADNLTMQNNTLTGTGGGPSASTPAAAIWLNGFNGDLTAQTGNQGNNNGLDLIAFHGTLTKGFTWKTPTNSGTPHALGYLLDGTMTLNGPETLTLKANDVVKLTSGSITLNGGRLDASDPAAGAKTITVARDNSVGMKTCPSQFTPDCPSPLPSYEYWGGVNLTADNVGNKGNASFINTNLTYGSLGIYMNSGANASVGQASYGLAFSNGSIKSMSNSGIYVSNSPVSITGTTIDTIASDGIYVSGSSGSVISGGVIQNVVGNGINLPGAAADVSRMKITAVGGTSTSYYAISSSGAKVTAECDSIHDNANGLSSSGNNGTSITYSNLVNNHGTNRYDVYASGATGAQKNWWGQSSGPATGQIGGTGAVDTSNFLTSDAPTVAIGLAHDNVNANGSMGKGTLTVTLTASRKLDTTIQPAVAINPGNHPVSGSWQADGVTWIGNYTMDSTTTSGGANTVDVSGARSCIPEPATNQMAATSKGFTADFSLPSADTGPATNVAEESATLNGTINPNGWNTSGYFEYGTTSNSYPTTTAPQAMGKGTTAQAIQQAVTGLTPFTTYYYRTVAASGNGNFEGPERSFVTPSILHFPALMNNAYGGYTTTIYLQNKSGAALAAEAISISYYDQSGTSVGTGDKSPALVDGGVWVIRQDNGHSFANGAAGSGRVNTTVPLVAFVNQEIGTGDGSSYSALPNPATGPTVYAPAVMNNAYGGYTTGMGITNTGSQTTTVTVTYHRADGTNISPVKTQSLASNAFWGLYQGEAGTPLSAGFAGTATISSNPPTTLAVIVNEVNAVSGQFLTYTASNQGAKKLYAPAIFNNAYGSYNTGMAIQNVSSATAHVSIAYSGVTNPETFTINAGGSVGSYNGGGASNATLPDGFHGSATITSDQNIVEIVNEVKDGVNYGTSYNTFAGGVPVVHLPLVENNHNGFSTGIGVENVGTGMATVSIVYSDPDTGAPLGTGPTLTLQPGEFGGVYQGPGGDGGVPAGKRAAATLTVTNAANGGKLAVIVNQQSTTSFMSYSGQ